jgi:subtilisin family serine protease
MRLIIALHKEADRDQFIRDLNDSGTQWEALELPRFFVVRGYSPTNFKLAGHPSIESVSEDLPLRPAARQSLAIDESLTTANWGIARIIRRAPPWSAAKPRFPLANDTFFECARDGAGVDIYIADSGIRAGHDEFGGRATVISGAYSDSDDPYGHGTSCLSLAAGNTVGVARGASLFSSQCLDSSGAGTESGLIACLGHILTHYNGRSGPAVLSLSLNFGSSTIASAIGDLIDAGVVVVASAGNGMSDLATVNAYPAEVTDVICVGGIGVADIPYYRCTDGTNWGTRIDVSAPAQRQWTAERATASSYRNFTGTSGACPLVAGAIACMLQGHARLTTRAQVQAIRAHVMAEATTGRLTNQFGITLPDRILYLDPLQTAPEPITGL